MNTYIKEKTKESKNLSTLIERADYINKWCGSFPEFNHDWEKIIEVVPCEDKRWANDEITFCLPIYNSLRNIVGIAIGHGFWELTEDDHGNEQWEKVFSEPDNECEYFHSFTETTMKAHKWLHQP